MSHVLQPSYLLLAIMTAVLIVSIGGVLAEDTLSSVSPVQQTQCLTFYTEQLPPYNYQENGSVKGFTIDILNEISAKSGLNLSPDMIHVVPWEEGYEAALNGTNTVIFSTARIPERENLFKWVGPISIERYVLFAPNESPITVDSPDNLKNLRIGAISGDASVSQLLAKGVNESSIVTADTISDLISMTHDKKIDLWAYPEITGRYYIGQITGNYDSFAPVYPLEGVGIYYAFSTDVSDATVSSYQKALDELKQQKNETGVSRYEQILEQYIPNTDLNIISKSK
jgi:polar amino acid transport system substrate-binding protein